MISRRHRPTGLRSTCASHIDVDAADGVDDFLEGLDVDDDVVVHVDAEEVLDGALRELLACLRAALGTAVGVGGVDLIPAVALDLDAGIARDGHQRGLILLWVERRDHQRVAAADVIVTLIDAHDHDGRLVLGGQQALLDDVIGRLVEQAVRREERAHGGRRDKGDDQESPKETSVPAA